MNIITIEEYISFINKMKTANLLKPSFRIIEYKDGCCLGCYNDNDDTRFVFWDEQGFAYCDNNKWTTGITCNDDNVYLQRILYPVPCPSLNHPQSQLVDNAALSTHIKNLSDACKACGRAYFAFITGFDKYTLNWGGRRDLLVSAFAELIANNKYFTSIMMEASELAGKIINKDNSTAS